MTTKLLERCKFTHVTYSKVLTWYLTALPDWVVSTRGRVADARRVGFKIFGIFDCKLKH